MDTSGELEFNEMELATFDTPEDFRDYLIELDNDHNLTDVSEMVEYFHQKSLDYLVYIKILKQFIKEKGI